MGEYKAKRIAAYVAPSAFISMFRKTLGTTPTLYFKTVAKG
jgi:AraC-like DNA-binding protein